MSHEPEKRDGAPSETELSHALPVEPVDASLRMRVQRAARAAYEREERVSFVWTDALVPGTLLLTGAFYLAGALQKLAEIFG
ncbi:MAG: hypothetical protein K1X94_17465 [Sandaracinaceae bacterium]|nr:hypothetical protein [Sandaracinaceae bacterium]